jgi:hypothetical protein
MPNATVRANAPAKLDPIEALAKHETLRRKARSVMAVGTHQSDDESDDLINEADRLLLEIARTPCASDDEFFVRAAHFLKWEINDYGDPKDYDATVVGLREYLAQRGPSQPQTEAGSIPKRKAAPNATDRVFALIARHKKAANRFSEVVTEQDREGERTPAEKRVYERAANAETRAMEAFLNHRPTTIAGLRASLDYLTQKSVREFLDFDLICENPLEEIARSPVLLAGEEIEGRAA